MSIYARIQNGVVVELITPPAGFTLAQLLPPAVAAMCNDVTAASPAVVVGDLATESGGVWSYAPSLTLAAAQAGQNGRLAASCAAAIIGGFQSSALGTAQTYPSTITDQANLTAAAVAAQANAGVSGWQATLWCCAAAGTWSYTAHSAAQVAQVFADWLAWREAQQAHLATQKAAVAAAGTVTAVQAIGW